MEPSVRVCLEPKENTSFNDVKKHYRTFLAGLQVIASQMDFLSKNIPDFLCKFFILPDCQSVTPVL